MENATKIGNQCSVARTEIKNVGSIVKQMIADAKVLEQVPGVDNGEVIANAIIVYRHLEDAAMRLGKVIQAIEGGKSIYDQNDATRVAGNGPVAPGTYAQREGENA